MLETTYCPNCGKQIDIENGLCPYCDFDLGNKENKNLVVFRRWKQLVLLGIGYLGLDIIYILISSLLKILATYVVGMNTPELNIFMDSLRVQTMLNIVCYIGMFIAQFALMAKDLHPLFRSFKHWKPIVAGVIGAVALYAFNVAYGTIVANVFPNLGNNANEAGLDQMILAYPVSSLIAFGLIGPFVEEVTYRLGLFTLLRRKNRTLAFVVTVFVFAFIHFTFSGDLLTEVVNIPYYIAAAYAFTIIYDKYGFAAGYYAHSINNLTSIILTLIIYKL